VIRLVSSFKISSVIPVHFKLQQRLAAKRGVLIQPNHIQSGHLIQQRLNLLERRRVVQLGDKPQTPKDNLTGLRMKDSTVIRHRQALHLRQLRELAHPEVNTQFMIQTSIMAAAALWLLLRQLIQVQRQRHITIQIPGHIPAGLHRKNPAWPTSPESHFRLLVGLAIFPIWVSFIMIRFQKVGYPELLEQSATLRGASAGALALLVEPLVISPG
jgi:hypothetical protein